MYDLSVKEKIPVSQLGQITSTDLANGVLISQGYTAFVNPGSTIAAGAGATALQNFVNAGGIYIGSVAGGTTSARNAGITLLNTASISGLSTPGSTFDGVFSTATPAGWGFDTGGWIYRSSSGDPTFNPATMVGNGTTIPAPTAVVTYGPSGDCGGPVFDISTTQRGYSNCYGYEVNANNTLPAANTSLPLPGPAGGRRTAVRGRARDPDRVRRVVPHVDDAGGTSRPERRLLPERHGDPRRRRRRSTGSCGRCTPPRSRRRSRGRACRGSRRGPSHVQPTGQRSTRVRSGRDHEVNPAGRRALSAGRAPVYFFTKLTEPFALEDPHCTSSKDAICWIRISSASSSGVMRWRRRFCSSSVPSWITTIGWPSSTFRTRRERKLTYEIRTCIAAIVEIAITAPVTE
jgi:hypothetical protein